MKVGNNKINIIQLCADFHKVLMKEAELLLEEEWKNGGKILTTPEEQKKRMAQFLQEIEHARQIRNIKENENESGN